MSWRLGFASALAWAAGSASSRDLHELKPRVYKKVELAITVPWQMIEGNLSLKAAREPVSAGRFWRLLLGTIATLAFGYAGDTGGLETWIGFTLGIGGGFYILKENFMGNLSGRPRSRSAHS